MVSLRERCRRRPADAASRRGRSLAGTLPRAQDGYTDLLYVPLPAWQQEFGLSFTGLALIRCRYLGTMGGLRIPAVGYLVMALPGGRAVFAVGLMLAGAGSSAWHPHSSLLVSQACRRAARRPPGIYSFAGDLVRHPRFRSDRALDGAAI